ncbi:MAG: RpiB/LacA/LacB family sugar-phosphate isomerase [bacterium]|nr:RpiB/LacA/LacB family sugar-phosphate isomerase [bacterium]
MQKSPIYLGADHAGFELKEALKKSLAEQGYTINDLSPDFQEGDDYPIIAHAVAERVAAGGEGILICGTGFGVDMEANRTKGVRAAVIRNEDEARLARTEDHANILVLGGRVTNPEDAIKIATVWLATPYGDAKRFGRRTRELDEL